MTRKLPCYMQFKKDEKNVPCIRKEKQKGVETLVVSDREKKRQCVSKIIPEVHQAYSKHSVLE